MAERLEFTGSMAVYTKISDDIMNDFQNKARQKLLLKKEDREWQNLCKQIAPGCATCSPKKADSKGIGIQAFPKKVFDKTEQKNLLINNSLKASLQKKSASYPRISKNPPSAIKLKNPSYILPHDLQMKNANTPLGSTTSTQTKDQQQSGNSKKELTSIRSSTPIDNAENLLDAAGGALHKKISKKHFVKCTWDVSGTINIYSEEEKKISHHKERKELSAIRSTPPIDNPENLVGNTPPKCICDISIGSEEAKEISEHKERFWLHLKNIN